MTECAFNAVDFFRARPLYQEPYLYDEYLRDHGPATPLPPGSSRTA